MSPTAKTAVVIGASSGIGRALCLLLSREGWRVAATARRLDLLESLKQEMSGPCVVQVMDVSRPQQAVRELQALLRELGDADLIVINAGVAGLNKELDYAVDEKIILTNVAGFTALAGEAMKHFLAQGRGHLAAVSSIAAIRGLAATPAYGASKAYMSNYLEALAVKARKSRQPIFVTDLRPGYVDTPMTEGQKNMFWVADSSAAARQMLGAIHARRRVAYITGRWRWVALVMRHLPFGLLAKMQ